jgi:hypothetical protein
VKEKNIEIIGQKLEMDCQYIISVRKNDADAIFNIFDNLYKVAVKVLG